MATGTAVDVVMPQMGVSVSEGTVTRWLKGVGETVEADEPLLEISTDKVDTEVPSPGSGVLSEILVQEGQTVAVGTLLARLGGDAGAAVPAAEEAEPEPAAEEVPEPATQAAADAAMASAEGGVREEPAAEQPLAPPTAPELDPPGRTRVEHPVPGAVRRDEPPLSALLHDRDRRRPRPAGPASRDGQEMRPGAAEPELRERAHDGVQPPAPEALPVRLRSARHGPRLDLAHAPAALPGAAGVRVTRDQ